jgi:outer membrane receptor protein involved in Fe transport
MTRSNADFRRTNAYVSANASLGSGTSLDCSLQRVTAQRGVPGSLDLPSLARQDDDNIQMTMAVRHAAPDGLTMSVNGAVQYSFQSYIDPLFPFASRYRNVLYTVNPEVQAVMTPWYRILAGAEYGHGVLDGNDFPAIARREQYSVFVSNELFLERTAGTFDRASIVLAGRYQTISDVNASAPFNDRIFFKAGLNVRMWKEYDLRLRASFGTNFRVPTFNDLYYPGFNNPDLKPERSRTMEAGLTSTLVSAVIHRFDVTAFSVDTRERILFDPAQSRPENIGRVESRGVEVQYRLTTRDESVQLLANASFTEAVKKNRSGPVDATYDRQLPYVPKTAGSLGIALGEEPLRVNVIQTYGGRRFTSVVNAPSLPPFARTDMNVSWMTALDDVRLRLRAEFSNLFDSDYQVYDGYPMPGRSFRASMVVEF